VFEDTALEMLEAEPALRAAFEQWKADHPALLDDQAAVLDFIYTRGARHAEPEWRRYPVLSVLG
jgi:predicted nucleic acid-binding OB-fold protein